MSDSFNILSTVIKYKAGRLTWCEYECWNAREAGCFGYLCLGLGGARDAPSF